MSGLVLRMIARLLAYPEAKLQLAVPEMTAVLDGEGALPILWKRRLVAFMDELAQRPLLEVQEDYVALFDRGRHLSLHLFEHVHGESRDRGQAMVDLLELYRAHGLELAAHELPDYLPLMLEYLSTRPWNEAQQLLGDAMGVIVLLGARLDQRQSPYAVLFQLLETMVGSPSDATEVRRAAAREGPDPTLENMDAIWAEEEVRFMANEDPAGNCGAQPQPADPLAAALLSGHRS